LLVEDVIVDMPMTHVDGLPSISKYPLQHPTLGGDLCDGLSLEGYL